MFKLWYHIKFWHLACWLPALGRGAVLPLDTPTFSLWQTFAVLSILKQGEMKETVQPQAPQRPPHSSVSPAWANPLTSVPFVHAKTLQCFCDVGSPHLADYMLGKDGAAKYLNLDSFPDILLTEETHALCVCCVKWNLGSLSTRTTPFSFSFSGKINIISNKMPNILGLT